MLDLLASAIFESADMRLDGSVDPLLACDAISLGIGFEAARVQVGGVANPVPAILDPCNP